MMPSSRTKINNRAHCALVMWDGHRDTILRDDQLTTFTEAHKSIRHCGMHKCAHDVSSTIIVLVDPRVKAISCGFIVRTECSV